MELRVILLVGLLGLGHWIFVPWALSELVERKRVLGGRKGIWALVILLLTYFGPVLYLALHPKPQEAESDYERIREY